jgi:hypothetical protein
MTVKELDNLLEYLWQASPWNKERIKKEVLLKIMEEFAEIN